MSFVCGLCGEWNEKWGPTVRIHPDLPASVAEHARICYDCQRALESAPDDSGCGWCDGGSYLEVWNTGVGPMGGSSGLRDVAGHLCRACWAEARGEYPPEFSDSLKRSVRDRAGEKCEECGMPQSTHQDEFGQKLHVHHKDGDKRNNDPNNLVALCARCHGSK
jgi:hypothetical protein